PDAPADPNAEMDQDAIDAMMAARQANKQAEATPEPAAEEPSETDAQPDASELDQSAIDAMMAARAQKKQAEENSQPQEEDGELDQDAIDAMMAARSQEKEAEPAAEEAPADPNAEMDQDAIDAMMAARSQKKEAEPAAEEEAPAAGGAELDQDAIDAMMAARSASAPKPAEEPAAPAASEEVDQDTIDAMMATRAQQKSAPSVEEAPAAAAPSKASAGSDAKPAASGALAKGKVILGRWSLMHWLFVSNGLLGLALLLGLTFMFAREEGPRQATASPTERDELAPAIGEKVRIPRLDIPDVGPTTWAEAEEALLSKRYDVALARYRKLMEMAESRWDNQRLVDLLKLREGQCLLALGQAERARQNFVDAAQSSSPIVRAYANYRLGLLRAEQGLYMRGRTRAYMAIAALGMMENPSTLEGDCDYLIASCLSRQVLSFYNPDQKVEWTRIEGGDPFMGVNESALIRMLQEGQEQMRRTVLGPEINPTRGTPGLDAVCWRSPVQEVLHRFETQTGLDVEWVGVSGPVRRRPVTMTLQGVSAQRISEVACGVVELVSDFSGSSVSVYDIRSMNSVAQVRGVLTRQAVLAWRQFFLRRPDDPRVARGHLALARLCEAEGDSVSAVQEYQLIAERFRENDAAPEAMMRSAQLKIELLDYDGARRDLLNLLDSYPDFRATDKLYLSLGNATYEAGLYDEASGVYRKLYYLNLSPETEAAACLGVGRCMVRQKNWDEAIRWLGRYIERTPDKSGDDLIDGMALLAQSHAAKEDYDKAIQYLYPAISLEGSVRENIRATLLLADVETRKDNLVRAVGAVERVPQRSVPKDLQYEYFRVRSNVYAGMGLFNRALSILRDGIEGTEDTSLRSRLGVQVGKVYVQAGEREAALRVLTEVVGSGKLPSGKVAQSAACDLGEVCVQMGKADQAVSAVEDVLPSAETEEIRDRAREILGNAYAMRREFNKAAAVLSGQGTEQGGGN
ncbi:MAG: hypothetical protein ACLFV7_14150, partial [Phycisphaerae bacterium]